MFRITVAIIFAVFLAILCVGVSHAGGWFHNAGRGPTFGQATRPGALSALTCAANCDLQFVADDWSGSGNWSARVGGWTATKSGTPVKNASAVFPGRSYIDSWSASDFFTIAANAAHTIGASGTVTYEWVLNRLPLAGGFASWYGNIVVGNAGGLFVYVNTANRFDIEVANTLANSYLGGLSASGAYVSDKAVLVTMTVDVAAPMMRLYVNGTELISGAYPDSSVSGTLTPLDCALGIGVRWSCNTSLAGDALSTIGIIEIVRHQVVLSPATIATRATQFNALKGY